MDSGNLARHVSAPNQQFIHKTMYWEQPKSKYAIIPQEYEKCSDKLSYIRYRMGRVVELKKLDVKKITLDELAEIIQILQVGLTKSARQMHEIYLYASLRFQPSSKSQVEQVSLFKGKPDESIKPTNRLKHRQLLKHRVKTEFMRNQRITSQDESNVIKAIVQKRQYAIDLNKAAEWVVKKLQTGQAYFLYPHVTQQGHSRSQLKPVARHRTLVTGTSSHAKSDSKAATIKFGPKERMNSEVAKVLSFFDRIKSQREENGIIPVNHGPRNQEGDDTPADIPYFAELGSVNSKIKRLKLKAEESLHEIIQASTDDKKLRKSLEEIIRKVEGARIIKNQRTGYLGSMKAQKRLIDLRKSEIDRLEKIRTNLNGNLNYFGRDHVSL